jgi:hypothetical protein
MNMSQRAREMLKEWALFFGLLIVLHIVYFVGWGMIGPRNRDDLMPIALLTIVYLVGFAALMVIFYKRLASANAPIEYHEAREQGIPATAKVLQIGRTRWRHKRSRNFRLQVRPQEFEYQMRVRVSREGEPDYEADVAEFLAGDDVPNKGDVIPIKVHPQRPEVIVLTGEKPKRS